MQHSRRRESLVLQKVYCLISRAAKAPGAATALAQLLDNSNFRRVDLGPLVNAIEKLGQPTFSNTSCAMRSPSLTAPVSLAQQLPTKRRTSKVRIRKVKQQHLDLPAVIRIDHPSARIDKILGRQSASRRDPSICNTDQRRFSHSSRRKAGRELGGWGIVAITYSIHPAPQSPAPSTPAPCRALALSRRQHSRGRSRPRRRSRGWARGRSASVS